MKLSLALALLLLAGCQTMREHPRTTAFIATSLALSAGIAYRDHDHSRPHDVATPSVVCASGSCK